MLWHIYIRRKKKNTTIKIQQVQQQNTTHTNAHKERKNGIDMNKGI